MRKNKLKTFIIMLMAFVLVGCSNNKIEDKAEVEESNFDQEIVTRVDGFISEMKNFNLNAFITYINPMQINNNELPNIDMNNNLFQRQLEYLKNNASEITYKVEDVKVKENEATVKIRFRYNDMSSVIENTLIKYVETAPSENNYSEEEKNKILSDILEKEIIESDPIYIEKSINVDMIKIEDVWYINNLNNDLINIMMSNYLYTFEKLDKNIN